MIPNPIRNLFDQFTVCCLFRMLLIIRDAPKIINAIPSRIVMMRVELVENKNANKATIITPTPKAIVET